MSIPKDCQDIKGLRVKIQDTACQIPEEVIPNRGARMSISSHPRKEGSDSVGIQAGFSTRKSERSPPPPEPTMNPALSSCWVYLCSCGSQQCIIGLGEGKGNCRLSPEMQIKYKDVHMDSVDNIVVVI